MNSTGTLFLIPTYIADETLHCVLPQTVIQIANSLDEFIVENERTARRFLISAGYTKPLESLVLHTLNKHTDETTIPSFIKSLLDGKNVGLLSEAGCPCIADPGSQIVQLAHQNNIRVKPLVGPSSIILALMASGFNGQNFAFNGYLPIDKIANRKKLRELEARAIKGNQTQIFMETPFRNMQLFEDIINTCNPAIRLCIAVDITGENESIFSMAIAEWKKQIPQLHKRTAIFLISNSPYAEKS